MMSFITHTGTAVPLRRSNIDTDQISPARFVPYYQRSGFSNMLFADWRDDRDFVLNQPQYQGATILVAGYEFGTGSSRESAVWALQSAGFDVVISPRFGDIFYGNALTKGLLAIPVDETCVERLWTTIETDPFTLITIDIEQQIVEFNTDITPFEIPSEVRSQFMTGGSVVDQTLRHTQDIFRYEQTRRATLPTTHRVEHSEARG